MFITFFNNTAKPQLSRERDIQNTLVPEVLTAPIRLTFRIELIGYHRTAPDKDCLEFFLGHSCPFGIRTRTCCHQKTVLCQLSYGASLPTRSSLWSLRQSRIYLALSSAFFFRQFAI